MGWFGELNRPDDFADDWYGELTNQLGHTMLGQVATVLLCFGYWAFSAASPYLDAGMPVRLYVAALVFVAYAGVVEWGIQGWRAGDSWFDTCMVMCGSASILQMREMQIDGFGLRVDVDARTVMGLILFWSMLLLFRVKKRYHNGVGHE